MMADENRDQNMEDQSQEESQKNQPAELGTATSTQKAQDNDDVQAYGEPSDGSGGTVKGG
jgi:hypothetical protein